jgi:hypothetical protein
MNESLFRKMIAITFIMVSVLLISIGDVMAGWTAMNSWTTGYLTDVGGCSGSDVFAVGESGTIVHYDGSNWSTMSSGTTEHLYGVWCNSGSDVFVVGAGGTILHYDGITWTAMTSGTTTAYFSDVWGSSGSDVFAVGSSGTVLHYNGTAWSSMSSATGEGLTGVWGSSGSDVFAVGDHSIKIHYNGTSWSAMLPVTTGSLNGIWGSSGSDVFAVGESGTILHYDGTTWTAMSSGTTTDSFQDVWGSSGTDVFAVSQPIFHYDGTGWSEMVDGSSWSPWHLNGIWGSSGSDVFAAGGIGIILHYDGNPAPASTTTSAMTTTTAPISTTTISPQSFAVAGTVTGAVSANIPVELLGDASQMVNTDNNGYYEFVNLTAGGSYVIIPQLDGYVFEPPEHVISNLAMDELDINFVASVAPLCPTEVIYGEDSEKTELLRYFRDYVLSVTPEGREIIKLYYQWSPVAVKAMEEDKVFEEEVKEMIDGALLLIGGAE